MLGEWLSSPLKRYITQSIQASLSKYIVNVDLEGLGVGGDLVLRDLELRLDVLQESLKIPLTFAFTRGFIKELRITIPWAHLFSQPIQIRISTIECILTARSELQFRRLKLKYERRRTRKRTTSHNSADGLSTTHPNISQPTQHGDDTGTHDASDASSADTPTSPNNESGFDEEATPGPASSSWLQATLTKVLGNARVIIDNLVLKYEHDNVLLSLSLKSLQINSADPKNGWVDAFQTPAGPRMAVHKEVRAEDLTVCLDRTEMRTQDEHVVGSSGRPKAAKAKESNSSNNKKKSARTRIVSSFEVPVLRRVSINVKGRINLAPMTPIPQIQNQPPQQQESPNNDMSDIPAPTAPAQTNTQQNVNGRMVDSPMSSSVDPFGGLQLNTTRALCADNVLHNISLSSRNTVNSKTTPLGSKDMALNEEPFTQSDFDATLEHTAVVVFADVYVRDFHVVLSDRQFVMIGDLGVLPDETDAADADADADLDADTHTHINTDLRSKPSLGSPIPPPPSIKLPPPRAPVIAKQQQPGVVLTKAAKQEQIKQQQQTEGGWASWAWSAVVGEEPSEDDLLLDILKGDKDKNSKAASGPQPPRVTIKAVGLRVDNSSLTLVMHQRKRYRHTTSSHHKQHHSHHHRRPRHLSQHSNPSAPDSTRSTQSSFWQDDDDRSSIRSSGGGGCRDRRNESCSDDSCISDHDDDDDDGESGTMSVMHVPVANMGTVQVQMTPTKTRKKPKSRRVRPIVKFAATLIQVAAAAVEYLPSTKESEAAKRLDAAVGGGGNGYDVNLNESVGVVQELALDVGTVDVVRWEDPTAPHHQFNHKSSFDIPNSARSSRATSLAAEEGTTRRTEGGGHITSPSASSAGGGGGFGSASARSKRSFKSASVVSQDNDNIEAEEPCQVLIWGPSSTRGHPVVGGYGTDGDGSKRRSMRDAPLHPRTAWTLFEEQQQQQRFTSGTTTTSPVNSNRAQNQAETHSTAQNTRMANQAARIRILIPTSPPSPNPLSNGSTTTNSLNINEASGRPTTITSAPNHSHAIEVDVMLGHVAMRVDAGLVQAACDFFGLKTESKALSKASLPDVKHGTAAKALQDLAHEYRHLPKRPRKSTSPPVVHVVLTVSLVDVSASSALGVYLSQDNGINGIIERDNEDGHVDEDACLSICLSDIAAVIRKDAHRGVDASRAAHQASTLARSTDNKLEAQFVTLKPAFHETINPALTSYFHEEETGSLWANIGVRAVSVNLGLRGPLTDVFKHAAQPVASAQQHQQEDRWSSAQSCMLRVTQPRVVVCHVKPSATSEQQNQKQQQSSLIQGNVALSLQQMHVSVTLLQLKATVAVLSTALGPLSRPLPEVTQLVESIQFGGDEATGDDDDSSSNSHYYNGIFQDGQNGEGGVDNDAHGGDDQFGAIHESLVVKSSIEGVLMVVATSGGNSSVSSVNPQSNHVSACGSIRAVVFEVAGSSGSETVFAGPVSKNNQNAHSYVGGAASYSMSSEKSDTLVAITARAQAPPALLVEKVGCALGLPKWIPLPEQEHQHKQMLMQQQQQAAAYGVGVCTLPSFVGWQGLNLVLEWVDAVGREVRSIASSDVTSTVTTGLTQQDNTNTVPLKLPASVKMLPPDGHSAVLATELTPQPLKTNDKQNNKTANSGDVTMSSLLANAARIDVQVELEPVSVMLSDEISLRLPVVIFRSVSTAATVATTPVTAPNNQQHAGTKPSGLFSMQVEYEIIGLRLLHGRQKRSLPKPTAHKQAQSSWQVENHTTNEDAEGVRQSQFAQAILPDVGCTGSVVVTQVLLPSQIGTSLNAPTIPPWQVHGLQIHNITQVNPVNVNLSTQNVNALCDIQLRKPRTNVNQRRPNPQSPNHSKVIKSNNNNNNNKSSTPGLQVVAMSTKLAMPTGTIQLRPEPGPMSRAFTLDNTIFQLPKLIQIELTGLHVTANQTSKLKCDSTTSNCSSRSRSSSSAVRVSLVDFSVVERHMHTGAKLRTDTADYSATSISTRMAMMAEQDSSSDNSDNDGESDGLQLTDSDSSSSLPQRGVHSGVDEKQEEEVSWMWMDWFRCFPRSVLLGVTQYTHPRDLFAVSMAFGVRLPFERMLVPNYMLGGDSSGGGSGDGVGGIRGPTQMLDHVPGVHSLFSVGTSSRLQRRRAISSDTQETVMGRTNNNINKVGNLIGMFATEWTLRCKSAPIEIRVNRTRTSFAQQYYDDIRRKRNSKAAGNDWGDVAHPGLSQDEFIESTSVMLPLFISKAYGERAGAANDAGVVGAPFITLEMSKGENISHDSQHATDSTNHSDIGSSGDGAVGAMRLRIRAFDVIIRSASICAAETLLKPLLAMTSSSTSTRPPSSQARQTIDLLPKAQVPTAQQGQPTQNTQTMNGDKSSTMETTQLPEPFIPVLDMGVGCARFFFPVCAPTPFTQPTGTNQTIEELWHTKAVWTDAWLSAHMAVVVNNTSLTMGANGGLIEVESVSAGTGAWVVKDDSTQSPENYGRRSQDDASDALDESLQGPISDFWLTTNSNSNLELSSTHKKQEIPSPMNVEFDMKLFMQHTHFRSVITHNQEDITRKWPELRTHSHVRNVDVTIDQAQWGIIMCAMDAASIRDPLFWDISNRYDFATHTTASARPQPRHIRARQPVPSAASVSSKPKLDATSSMRIMVMGDMPQASLRLVMDSSQGGRHAAGHGHVNGNNIDNDNDVMHVLVTGVNVDLASDSAFSNMRGHVQVGDAKITASDDSHSSTQTGVTDAHSHAHSDTAERWQLLGRRSSTTTSLSKATATPAPLMTLAVLKDKRDTRGTLQLSADCSEQLLLHVDCAALAQIVSFLDIRTSRLSHPDTAEASARLQVKRIQHLARKQQQQHGMSSQTTHELDDMPGTSGIDASNNTTAPSNASFKMMLPGMCGVVAMRRGGPAVVVCFEQLYMHVGNTVQDSNSNVNNIEPIGPRKSRHTTKRRQQQQQQQLPQVHVRKSSTPFDSSIEIRTVELQVSLPLTYQLTPDALHVSSQLSTDQHQPNRSTSTKSHTTAIHANSSPLALVSISSESMCIEPVDLHAMIHTNVFPYRSQMVLDAPELNVNVSKELLAVASAMSSALSVVSKPYTVASAATAQLKRRLRSHAMAPPPHTTLTNAIKSTTAGSAPSARRASSGQGRSGGTPPQLTRLSTAPPHTTTTSTHRTHDQKRKRRKKKKENIRRRRKNREEYRHVKSPQYGGAAGMPSSSPLSATSAGDRASMESTNDDLTQMKRSFKRIGWPPPGELCFTELPHGGPLLPTHGFGYFPFVRLQDLWRHQGTDIARQAGEACDPDLLDTGVARTGIFADGNNDNDNDNNNSNNNDGNDMNKYSWVSLAWRYHKPRIVTGLVVEPVPLPSDLVHNALGSGGTNESNSGGNQQDNSDGSVGDSSGGGSSAIELICQLCYWDAVRRCFVVVLQFGVPVDEQNSGRDWSNSNGGGGTVARGGFSGFAAAFSGWLDESMGGLPTSKSGWNKGRAAAGRQLEAVRANLPQHKHMSPSDVWMLRWRVPNECVDPNAHEHASDLDHRFLAVSTALASSTHAGSMFHELAFPLTDVSVHVDHIRMALLHRCGLQDKHLVKELIGIRGHDVHCATTVRSARMLADGKLLTDTLVKVRGEVGVVVQSFKDLRETHIMEPSAMSVEVAIEPDGAQAVDVVASRCRVVCARTPVLAFVHGATVFMEDVSDASVLTKQLLSLLRLNENAGGNGSINAVNAISSDVLGAQMTTNRLIEDVRAANDNSQSVSVDGVGTNSSQAPEHSCECMRYLIVNHTNQRLWYGQHATQEELSLEAADKVSYSWCVVHTTKTKKGNQDRNNSMRFALDNAALQTGKGATGAGTWSEALHVDVVGVHRRVLHYDAAAQAGSLLRHGDSTVLWISVQLGHGGLQTVVNLFSSHTVLSHVPKRLNVCWAVVPRGPMQFPQVLSEGSNSTTFGDNTGQLSATRQAPVSLDAADVDATFASHFGNGSIGENSDWTTDASLSSATVNGKGNGNMSDRADGDRQFNGSSGGTQPNSTSASSTNNVNTSSSSSSSSHKATGNRGSDNNIRGVSQPLGMIDPHRTGSSSVESSIADGTPRMPLMVPLGLTGGGRNGSLDYDNDGSVYSGQQHDDVMLFFRQHQGDPWSEPVCVSSQGERVLVKVPGSAGSRPLFCWFQTHAVHLIDTSQFGQGKQSQFNRGGNGSSSGGESRAPGREVGNRLSAWNVLEVWPTAYFVNDAPWPIFCRIRPGRSGEADVNNNNSRHDDTKKTSRLWPVATTSVAVVLPAQGHGVQTRSGFPVSMSSPTLSQASVGAVSPTTASVLRVESGARVALFLDPSANSVLLVARSPDAKQPSSNNNNNHADEDDRKMSQAWSSPALLISESLYDECSRRNYCISESQSQSRWNRSRVVSVGQSSLLATVQGFPTAPSLVLQYRPCLVVKNTSSQTLWVRLATRQQREGNSNNKLNNKDKNFDKPIVCVPPASKRAICFVSDVERDLVQVAVPPPDVSTNPSEMDPIVLRNYHDIWSDAIALHRQLGCVLALPVGPAHESHTTNNTVYTANNNNDNNNNNTRTDTSTNAAILKKKLLQAVAESESTAAAQLVREKASSQRSGSMWSSWTGRGSTASADTSNQSGSNTDSTTTEEEDAGRGLTGGWVQQMWCSVRAGGLGYPTEISICHRVHVHNRTGEALKLAWPTLLGSGGVQWRDDVVGTASTSTGASTPQEKSLPSASLAPIQIPAYGHAFPPSFFALETKAQASNSAKIRSWFLRSSNGDNNISKNRDYGKKRHNGTVNSTSSSSTVAGTSGGRARASSGDVLKGSVNTQATRFPYVKEIPLHADQVGSSDEQSGIWSVDEEMTSSQGADMDVPVGRRGRPGDGFVLTTALRMSAINRAVARTNKSAEGTVRNELISVTPTNDINNNLHDHTANIIHKQQYKEKKTNWTQMLVVPPAMDANIPLRMSICLPIDSASSNPTLPDFELLCVSVCEEAGVLHVVIDVEPEPPLVICNDTEGAVCLDIGGISTIPVSQLDRSTLVLPARSVASLDNNFLHQHVVKADMFRIKSKYHAQQAAQADVINIGTTFTAAQLATFVGVWGPFSSAASGSQTQPLKNSASWWGSGISFPVSNTNETEDGGGLSGSAQELEGVVPYRFRVAVASADAVASSASALINYSDYATTNKHQNSIAQIEWSKPFHLQSGAQLVELANAVDKVDGALATTSILEVEANNAGRSTLVRVRTVTHANENGVRVPTTNIAVSDKHSIVARQPFKVRVRFDGIDASLFDDAHREVLHLVGRHFTFQHFTHTHKYTPHTSAMLKSCRMETATGGQMNRTLVTTAVSLQSMQLDSHVEDCELGVLLSLGPPITQQSLTGGSEGLANATSRQPSGDLLCFAWSKEVMLNAPINNNNNNNNNSIKQLSRHRVERYNMLSVNVPRAVVGFEDVLVRRLAEVFTPMAASLVAQTKAHDRSISPNANLRRSSGNRNTSCGGGNSIGSIGRNSDYNKVVPNAVTVAQNTLPLQIKHLKISPLVLEVTVRSTRLLPVSVGIERTPLYFSGINILNICATQQALINDLLASYVADALFTSPMLLGSLEILGNPSGWVRSTGAGLRDLFGMPLNALMHGWGAGELLRSVAGGWSSLLLHVGDGTLSSLAGFTGGLARNIDRLSMDPEFVRRREGMRRQRNHDFYVNGGVEGTAGNNRNNENGGVQRGLARGLRGFGEGMMGAATGVVTMPLRSGVESGWALSSVLKGVGKGLVGVIAKPVGGAADLIAEASDGIRQSAGMAGPGPSQVRPPQSLKWVRNKHLHIDWKLLREGEHALMSMPAECCDPSSCYSNGAGISGGVVEGGTGRPVGVLLVLTINFLYLYLRHETDDEDEDENKGANGGGGATNSDGSKGVSNRMNNSSISSGGNRTKECGTGTVVDSGLLCRLPWSAVVRLEQVLGCPRLLIFRCRRGDMPDKFIPTTTTTTAATAMPTAASIPRTATESATMTSATMASATMTSTTMASATPSAATAAPVTSALSAPVAAVKHAGSSEVSDDQPASSTWQEDNLWRGLRKAPSSLRISAMDWEGRLGHKEHKQQPQLDHSENAKAMRRDGGYGSIGDTADADGDGLVKLELWLDKRHCRALTARIISLMRSQGLPLKVQSLIVPKK